MLDEPWRLTPMVALRPEPFGALAYHFGNRQLIFLKRPDLVRVVELLESHPDVRSALSAAGVPPAQHEAYAKALAELAASDMIRPREPARQAEPDEHEQDRADEQERTDALCG